MLASSLVTRSRSYPRRAAGAVLCAALAWAAGVRADEGMWPFNHVPRAEIARRHGFDASPGWLEHVMRSSLRVGSCSGSFVSAQGLVLTNQHCAVDCLARLSTTRRDYLRQGFYARSAPAELRCPGDSILQLLQISDVTERLRQATEQLAGARYERALQAESARIEASCASPGLWCEVVPLYQGALYELYRYRRYDDVRLVFAPEHELAQFGGEPDNFDFPRFSLDVTFLRAYEHGQPASTPDFLRWSSTPLAPNDLAFTAGSPGSTERQRTAAQLAFLRDHALLEELTQLAGYRGFLTAYAGRSAAARRWVMPELFRVENRFKERYWARRALAEPGFFDSLVAAEQALRARVAANPEWQRELGGAWDAIASAQVRSAPFAHEWLWIEGPSGFRPPWAKTILFFWARTLVRAAAERSIDDSRRLPEYNESRLPGLEQRVLAEQPLDRDLESAKLAYGLKALREALGPDHPFVREVLGRASPAERARQLVAGSSLECAAERRRLWQGGQAAVLASRDPMIQLALAIDADGRALRARQEAELESVVAQNAERVARARFAVYGLRRAPDATSSPRLSFGTVRGWRDPRTGRWVPAFTTLRGLLERATGRAPYVLPERWLALEGRLRLDTPFNFVTDNDAVGGSSGSPVLNRDGELVGVLFDGNLPSLAGDYGFDLASNRAISVDIRAIVHALEVVYGARRVTAEVLQGPAAKK